MSGILCRFWKHDTMDKALTLIPVKSTYIVTLHTSKSILILTSHLRLDLSCSLFPWGLFYTFLFLISSLNTAPVSFSLQGYSRKKM